FGTRAISENFSTLGNKKRARAKTSARFTADYRARINGQCAVCQYINESVQNVLICVEPVNIAREVRGYLNCCRLCPQNGQDCRAQQNYLSSEFHNCKL